MKLLIQRVKYAKVTRTNSTKTHTHKIDTGILAFIGITHTDTTYHADWLADKLTNLRLFDDANGKTNLSIKDINGSIMIIPQFTLYASFTHGRRPSFTDAATANKAEELYNYFTHKTRTLMPADKVTTGWFASHMDVALLNDGPFTLIISTQLYVLISRLKLDIIIIVVIMLYVMLPLGKLIIFIIIIIMDFFYLLALSSRTFTWGFSCYVSGGQREPRSRAGFATIRLLPTLSCYLWDAVLEAAQGDDTIEQ